MKKVILVFILPLAMLMAEMTLKGGQLTNEPVAAETTAPVVENTSPVNTSGIIPNSIDLIWDDMHGKADSAPMGSGNWDMFNGPVFWGHLTTCATWEKSNVWIEVEEDAGYGHPCSQTTNQSTNTMVEVGPMWGAWLSKTTNKWTIFFNGTTTFNGMRLPSEGHMSYDSALNRGCSDAEAKQFFDLRAQYPDWEVDMGRTATGNLLLRPGKGWRTHYWARPAQYTPLSDTKAFYGGYWARLVLIDPNGPDDRYKARYIIHGAADAKQADSSTACKSGVAGISRYKLIPQNGDWMPLNFLDGNITREELEANPPPFPMTPTRK